MRMPAATADHAFGVLSGHIKDQMYLLRRGHIFATPWVVTETTRFAGSILLTAKRDPFELSVGGVRGSYRAAAIKPMTTRHLRAENVQLVSIGISPNHRHYRRFRTIGCRGYLPLPREAYAAFDRAFESAYEGKLTTDEAAQLFEDLVELTVGFLPRARRADPRIERALEMLQENSHYPLTELAAAVGLSYDRMSHLFSEAVGLPLRSYLLWQKLHAVSSLLSSGLTLTEMAAAAGFTDSAHLSNAWQRTYGAPPSYFIHSGCVEIHSQRRDVAPRRGPESSLPSAVARQRFSR